MRHQRLIGATVASEFPLIIGEGLLPREKRREAGQACVDGIAAAMEDARVGKDEADEATAQEVRRHLSTTRGRPAASPRPLRD